MEQAFFFLGLVVFAGATLFFFLRREKCENCSMAYLVSSVTTLAYLVLLEGSLVSEATVGMPVYYTRWLFYAASCSLLMLTIAKVIKLKKGSVLTVVVLNALVMLSGAIASVMSGPFKWIIFGFGTAFFVDLLIVLCRDSGKSSRAGIAWGYIFFGWSAFPIVFLSAPEGFAVISNVLAAGLYLTLDIATKVIFYLHLESRSR